MNPTGKTRFVGLGRVLLYFPGAVAPAAGSFLLSVALARKLSPDQFGLFAIAMSVITIVGTASAQWVAQPLTRFLPTSLHRRTLLTGAAKSAIIASIGSAVLSALTFGAISSLGDTFHWRLVAWATAAVTVNAALLPLALVGLAAWQASFRPDRYSRLQIGVNGGRLFAAVVGGIGLGTHTGALWGAATGTALALIAEAAFLEWPLDPGLRSRVWFRRLWRAGRPYIPWTLCSTFLAVGDRLVLGTLVSPSAVGSYSAQYALATGAITLLSMPILLFAHPEIMRRWGQGKEREARRLITRLSMGIGMVSVCIAAMSAIGGQALTSLIFGDGYAAGSRGVLPILCLATATWQVSLYLQKPLEAAGHASRMVGPMLLAVAVNILLALTLVSKLGVAAGAIATLISYLSYAIAVWLESWNGSLGIRVGVAFLLALAAAAIPHVWFPAFGLFETAVSAGLAFVGVAPSLMSRAFRRFGAVPTNQSVSNA